MQTKPILLAQDQIALTAFASHDKYRSDLAVLNVTSEAVEATNGHICVRVPHSTMPAEDFPVNPSIPALTGPNGKPVVLSVESVKSGARCAEKKSRIPVLGRALCGFNAQGQGVIASTDMESVAVGQTGQDGQRFPVIDKVIPERSGKIRVGLNAKYLKAIADYAMKHGTGHESDRASVVFYFERNGDAAESSACRIEVGLEEDRQLVGALMPIRI